MGQISVEIMRPTGSLLGGNQHHLVMASFAIANGDNSRPTAAFWHIIYQNDPQMERHVPTFLRLMAFVAKSWTDVSSADCPLTAS